jgi:putative acetyltransferase
MIRRYREKDCDAVIAIWLAASRVATPFLGEEFLLAEQATIRDQHLPNAETWVYEEDGAVVGFLALIGHEVGGLFVDMKSQGQGVGRVLMDHARELRGSLYLDVFKDNAVGRRFYDRYGFRFRYEHLHAASGHVQLRLALP